MTDPSQPATVDANRLALQRTHLATTRTLLALIRTGAVISGGGALVTELLVKAWPRWVVVVLSSAFIVLGYWIMWSAVRKARRLRVRYEHEADMEGLLVSQRQFATMTLVLQILIAAVVGLYLLGQ